MNEKFITNGLEEDQYLKADKLVQQFRNQIREAIENLSQDIIEENSSLFPENVSLDYKEFGIENSRTLTTIRVEHDLQKEHEEYGTCRLNIGLEWVESGEQDVDSQSDGALCYVLYKIQRGSETCFNKVKDRTVDSNRWGTIHFGEDQWPYKRKEAPGIIYIPVESGSEITEGLHTLKEHFSEEYAEELMD